MRNKIILISLNIIALLYTFSYLYDKINGKVVEGYGIAISGFLFDIIAIPFLIYFSVKNKTSELKFLIIMMVSYTLCGFTGPKISFYLSIVFSLTSSCILLLKRKQ
jgi:hypothetical protein